MASYHSRDNMLNDSDTTDAAKKHDASNVKLAIKSSIRRRQSRKLQKLTQKSPKKKKLTQKSPKKKKFKLKPSCPAAAAYATQIPVANAYYVPPINPHRVAFHENLRALTERIALNPANTCGAIGPPECNNRWCPYSSGNLVEQRNKLMVRAFQINHVLSANLHLFRSSLDASQDNM